jgi:hypothetical protein
MANGVSSEFSTGVLEQALTNLVEPIVSTPLPEAMIGLGLAHFIVDRLKDHEPVGSWDSQGIYLTGAINDFDEFTRALKDRIFEELRYEVEQGGSVSRLWLFGKVSPAVLNRATEILERRFIRGRGMGGMGCPLGVLRGVIFEAITHIAISGGQVVYVRFLQIVESYDAYFAYVILDIAKRKDMKEASHEG